ncbi:MAG: cardiolipin synthase [Thermodesulfobacteriota bacterium]
MTGATLLERFVLQDLTLAGLAHVAIGLALSLHVLLHKHRPVSAVLWLGILWAFPFVGALVYLGFGIDQVERGGVARDACRAILRELSLPGAGAAEALRQRAPVPAGRGSEILRTTSGRRRDLAQMGGNAVELLVDGDEFYPALDAAIDAARDSIHLQSFIIARDATGRRLVERLARRTAEGVTVRLLYDRFGSTYAHYSTMFRTARRAGVRVASISHASPLRGRFQVNLRNHRKVAVIDGRIGFTGGINVGDLNVTGASGRPPIRDYHVRIEGPAVSELQLQFVADWTFASGEAPADVVLPRYFPVAERRGDALLHVLATGPYAGARALTDLLFAAIGAAERSLRVVTPYFVPNEPVLQAIRAAALRGVDTRLVVPQLGNHWYVDFAARSLYTPLLESGVRIFERKPPFSHAKALVVDESYAVLGSANLDYRSLHLNFESVVEVVEAAFLARLNAQIESELAHSVEASLEAHRARPMSRRLAENFCYLFQPLL